MDRLELLLALAVQEAQDEQRQGCCAELERVAAGTTSTASRRDSGAQAHVGDEGFRMRGTRRTRRLAPPRRRHTQRRRLCSAIWRYTWCRKTSFQKNVRIRLRRRKRPGCMQRTSQHRRGSAAAVAKSTHEINTLWNSSTSCWLGRRWNLQTATRPKAGGDGM